MLSHTREWLTNPSARYPPGLVLEQLTAPTPGVRHALHRASALTEQLNDESLDLALEPLRVLNRRPTFHPRARSTAWAAWVCSAASRPRTEEAWWNSG